MQVKFNVILVRHTETDWNTQHRYSGQSDVPTLNGNGLRQAFLLAQKLSEYPVTQIVCSDLRRARDTATMLGGPHGLIPIIDPRLREVGLGKMDGLRKIEALARYAKDHLSTRSLHYDFSELGGESRDTVIERHRAVFEEYVRQNTGVILFVGHGTSLRTFLESREQEAMIEQGGYRTLWY